MKFSLLSLLFFLAICPLTAQPPGMQGPTWMVGGMLIRDSQPYKGADGRLYGFPTVSYRGERLEWFGPLVRYRLAGDRFWSVSAHSVVDFPAFEEDDSPDLAGMNDREYTLLGGLTGRFELNRNWGLAAMAEGDLLGTFSGYQGSLSVNRRLGTPAQPLSGGLSAGIYYQDENWANDRVGVTLGESTADRPVYRVENSVHSFVSGRAFYRFAERASLTLIVRAEFLDDAWTDSPIVSDSTRLSTVLQFNWSF